MDGEGGGGADGIGHVETGEALISLSEPDNGFRRARTCRTKGWGNIHLFLLEKGELAEEEFCSLGLAGDALAWCVLNIGDFVEG